MSPSLSARSQLRQRATPARSCCGSQTRGPARVMSFALIALMTLGLGPGNSAETPVELSIAGDWEVRVSRREPRAIETTLPIAPPRIISITDEKFESLPLFNPKAGGWVKGAQLRGVRAQETTTPFLLEPDSLVLRSGPGADAGMFRKGEDYEADLPWGTIGRLTNGLLKAGQPVYASYRHAQLRLDAVVLARDGRVVLRPGEPRAAAPLPPRVESGERHL